MKTAPKLLPAALLLAVAATGASLTALAGVCLPNSKTYTKCIDGRIAQCSRSRNIKCKTRERCTQTEQTCDPRSLVR
jgi:hypothetical protein